MSEADANTATVFDTVIAFIGLFAIVYTIWQTRKHHVDSMKLSQYITITQRVFDVDMLFINNSKLRPYFRDGQIVDQSLDVQEVSAIAEYILDFFSTIQEHERLLTSQATPSWEEWRDYRSSPDFPAKMIWRVYHSQTFR